MNSFLNNPYGLDEKYGITNHSFQKDFKDLENQLEQLQLDDFDFMYSQFIPQNLTDLR